MTAVLITAIGGDVAQSVASVLREAYPNWRLIGADIHERHGGALFVDRLYRGIAAHESGYEEWVSDLIEREAVSLCVPMSEPELRHFLERGKETCGRARLVMPNLLAISIGIDKLATADFLDSIGCPVPETTPADGADLGALTWPRIYKPRRSSGSRSVFVCSSVSDAKFYRERFPGGVFQELLLPADREVTCAVFRASSGETVVLQLLRKLVGGLTGWASVIENPQVDEQCRLLARAMDLRGSINVQLRITDVGPRIFEINPRFSSTALMRHRIGFRDVVWALQDMMGEQPEFVRPAVGTTVVRTQGAIVLGQSREGVAK